MQRQQYYSQQYEQQGGKLLCQLLFQEDERSQCKTYYAVAPAYQRNYGYMHFRQTYGVKVAEIGSYKQYPRSRHAPMPMELFGVIFLTAEHIR